MVLAAHGTSQLNRLLCLPMTLSAAVLRELELVRSARFWHQQGSTPSKDQRGPPASRDEQHAAKY